LLSMDKCKKKYIVFKNQGGARIYINPENPEELGAQGEVLLDPDLALVAGLPPEEWGLKDGLVVKYVAPEPVVAEALPEAAKTELSVSTGAKILLFRRRRYTKIKRVLAACAVAAILYFISRGAL